MCSVTLLGFFQEANLTNTFSIFYAVFKEQVLNNVSYSNGGDEENRTPDPLLARQVLSQLSYAPMCK